MSQEWIIRLENDADYEAIDRVVIAASGEEETAELVRRLRTDGDVLVSLVAESASRIVGHIMMILAKQEKIWMTVSFFIRKRGSATWPLAIAGNYVADSATKDSLVV